MNISSNTKDLLSNYLDEATIEKVSHLEQYFNQRKEVKSNKINMIDFDQSLSMLKNYQENGIDILKTDFNPYFETIQSMLWIRGESDSILRSPKIAIVGTRNADPEGVSIAREFAKFLAESGAQIISGLALGIDAAAHVGALMSNQEGSTIAVLGNGLEIIYPATHMQLANKIIQAKGAILSQFMPGEGPMKHHFLMRNRVIAALADAIIVIQAPKKSGAISTVIHAIEFGKDVFVVPGSIKDPRYEGSNNLIKQGAGVITGPEDLFSLLPSVLKKQNKAVKILHLTEEEAVFMEKIPTEGIFADDLLIDSKNHEIFCIMLSSGVLIQDLNGKIRKKT